MGTNFYWRTAATLLPTGEESPEDSNDPRIHIGKRSAAGPYCWDCEQTLCKDGIDGIHSSRSDWFSACPRCGKERVDVPVLSRGAAAVELGFAKPEMERPSGVSTTSSFSWAQDPERVGAICEEAADTPVVVDEYGDELTGTEFLAMLRANCGVQFTDSIGQAFS